MNRTTLILSVMALTAAGAWAHDNEDHDAQPRLFDASKVEDTAFGREGDPAQATRTIPKKELELKFSHIGGVAAIVLAAFAATAQTQPAPGNDHAAHPMAVTAGPQSEGEVRKIDKGQGKLTLRHGPLATLDMPAMTMVFKAADPKPLDGLKEGDKVRFTAEKIDGALTVTAIQPTK